MADPAAVIYCENGLILLFNIMTMMSPNSVSIVPDKYLQTNAGGVFGFKTNPGYSVSYATPDGALVITSLRTSLETQSLYRTSVYHLEDDEDPTSLVKP